jgi:hypothetical protein
MEAPGWTTKGKRMRDMEDTKVGEIKEKEDVEVTKMPSCDDLTK